MACTPGFIAAERLWAPLCGGSRHAGVGAPSFVSSNRNAPLLFCLRSAGWDRLAVWGVFDVRA